MDEREEIIQCQKGAVLIKVRKGETMKKIWKRALSYVLVAALVFSVCPTTVKKAKAATSSVALANLGALGSLSVGTKTKTGKWWMMRVGGKKAFCMNLGYTCHTGDVYEDSSATYHSTDSGNKKLKAYIGYWYDQTMDESRKAFVMAQALFWAVEEGDTSEEKLKAVISKVKSNTGYFSTKTANQLYSSIFEKSGTFSIKVKEWKYAGSGSQRQELLVIDSGVKPEPESLVTNDFYRQRIKIQKTDEDGIPMAGTSFKIAAENIDELYSYRINGTTTDADEDIASFEIDTKTDADGWINLRLTYRIHTNEYFFLKDDELAAMDSDAKKAIKEEWDDKGMLYASNLTYDGAKELMEIELDKQIQNIANRYTITETNSGNPNIVINPEYKNGKTIVVDWQKSWWRGGGNTVRLDWDEVPENPYVEEVQNHYKKVAVSVKKVDAYNVLLKPGRLTEQEFELMKSHTTRGCDILNNIEGVWDEDYCKTSYDICRHHHERYDGRGYPDRLKGEEIPISAQIVSIADVYDALVSERVYKNAYSKEEAFHMIIHGECGVFSPKLLESFRHARTKFENLADNNGHPA